MLPFALFLPGGQLRTLQDRKALLLAVQTPDPPDELLADSLAELAALAAIGHPEPWRVAVVLGAVQWPNGADLAPDAIREHGCWVVGS